MAGWTDVPLSSWGRLVIERLKRYLARGPRFDAIYSSPLSRASETAPALSLAVDREIGQVREVLETLAASPYLDSQDFKAFYELSSRAAKEHNDSSIVLLDRSGQQITNTLRPFGAPLPSAVQHAKEPPADDIDQLPQGTPETVQKVIDSGEPVVTDLFMGIVIKRPTVSIAVPVKFTSGTEVILTSS